MKRTIVLLAALAMVFGFSTTLHAQQGWTSGPGPVSGPTLTITDGGETIEQSLEGNVIALSRTATATITFISPPGFTSGLSFGGYGRLGVEGETSEDGTVHTYRISMYNDSAGTVTLGWTFPYSYQFLKYWVTVIYGYGTAPPSITSEPVTLTATEDVPYAYDVNATDEDAGDVLTFSLDVWPIGMTIDPGTGLISWTPIASTPAGDNDVTVRVTDRTALFDTQSFVISVTKIPAITAEFRTVQAIDNTQNTTDLVAGKNTVLRSFILLPAGSPEMQATLELCIDGDGDGDCPGATHRINGTIYPEDKTFSVDELRNATNSLNFMLVGNIANNLTSGTHSFSIDVSPVQAKEFREATYRFHRTFRDSVGFEILTVPIQIPDAARVLQSPDNGLVSTADKMLASVYPVDEDRVSTRTIGTERVAASDSLHWTPVQELVVKRIKRKLDAVRLRTPTDNKLYAAGVVKGIVDEIPGLQDVTEGKVLAGRTWPGIKGVVLSVDISPSSGMPRLSSTLSHEIGHQEDLGDEYCFDGGKFSCVQRSYYVNSFPQNVTEGDVQGRYISSGMGAYDVNGFVRGRKAVFGSSAGDVYGYMGSADDLHRWTGDFEYNYLFNKFTGGPASKAGSAAEAARDVVAVYGNVNRNGDATLDPPNIVTTDAAIPSLSGTDYSIQFRDGSNTVLGEALFDISFEVAESYADGTAAVVPVDETPFSVLVELPSGTDSISFWEGDTQLDELTRTANTPVVEVTDVFGSGDVIDIAWTGSDADDDTLLYSVLYSPDGIEMEVLTVTPDNSVTFDVSKASDISIVPKMAFVRVRASDGFNSAEVEVDDLPMQPTGNINDDDAVNAIDVQLVINEALGIATGFSCDINWDGNVNAVDVQLVINAALGIDISG